MKPLKQRAEELALQIIRDSMFTGTNDQEKAKIIEHYIYRELLIVDVEARENIMEAIRGNK